MTLHVSPPRAPPPQAQISPSPMGPAPGPPPWLSSLTFLPLLPSSSMTQVEPECLPTQVPSPFTVSLHCASIGASGRARDLGGLKSTTATATTFESCHHLGCHYSQHSLLICLIQASLNQANTPIQRADISPPKAEMKEQREMSNRNSFEGGRNDVHA